MEMIRQAGYAQNREVIRWVRHAQYMGVITHEYVKICQKPEGIRPYAKLSHRWKMYVCVHTHTHTYTYTY
jgi:hypothetical protein